jgi:hypothetical protein
VGLALVEVVLAVEEAFDIRISEGDFEKFVTVDDVATYVLAARVDGSDGIDGTLTREHVQERLAWILSEQLDVPMAMVRPATRLLDLAPDG